jgi:hypothetical protein
MVKTTFSFAGWAARLGRMLECVERNGPVNYYRIKNALKGKGYGGGTMQHDLQLLTQLGFIAPIVPLTKKRNRKADYELTTEGLILLLSIASYISSFRTRNYVHHLLHRHSTLLPKISSVYGEMEKLKITGLPDALLLNVASEFYDKSTISSFHNLHPSIVKSELAARFAERRNNPAPFEHRFFMAMAPPSTHLKDQRVKLERALQSRKGTTIRKRVIAELENERAYYSARAGATNEAIRFLNLENAS